MVTRTDELPSFNDEEDDCMSYTPRYLHHYEPLPFLDAVPLIALSLQLGSMAAQPITFPRTYR